MGVLQDAYNFFLGRGYSSNAAAGISAGLYAESNLNPTNVNPTSGAYGVGQWLGARKSSLFNTYGANPTFTQQLGFVDSELRAGNGGSVIANSSSPSVALGNFINLFERPGPGTAGDMTRGNNALTQLGADPLASGGNLLDDALSWIGGGSPGDFSAGLDIITGKRVNDKGQNAYQAATDIWSVFTQGVWTRFSFGLVGILLIGAAIFILLDGPKYAAQAAKTAAKAAIAA